MSNPQADNSTETVTSPSGDENRAVSYESYQRTLSQVKASKSRERELTERLNALEAEKEAEKNAVLAEQNRFKELYEQTNAKAEEAQAKLLALHTQQMEQRKRDAVASHIGPIHKPEFLQFVRLDQVDLDNPESITTEANRFKTEYPMVLQSAAAPTHLDTPPQNVVLSSNAPINELSDDELDRLFSTQYKGK